MPEWQPEVPENGERITLQESKLRVPDRPGTGFTFDKKAVNRFSI